MDIDAAIAWLESMGSDSMAASAARRIATYVWSHFRDRMPAELTPSFIGDAPLPVLLAQLAGGPCQTALVMGIGAGRLPLELAALGAEVVVALDLDPMFVAFAQDLARDHCATLPIPQGAVRWTRASFELPPRLAEASRRVVPLCADALDPPLPHRSFDLVVLPNLLDNISDPLALLAEAHALTAPGGRLVIATPFAWQRNVTPPAARLEAQPWCDPTGVARCLDGPETLVGLLTGELRSPLGFRMHLERSAVLPWHLRLHARQFNTFECHAYVFRNVPPHAPSSARDASCR